MSDPMPRSWMTELGQNHASPQSAPYPVQGSSNILTNHVKPRHRAPQALQEEALNQEQCYCGPTLERGCQLRSDTPSCNRRGVCSALWGWLSSDNCSWWVSEGVTNAGRAGSNVQEAQVGVNQTALEPMESEAGKLS